MVPVTNKVENALIKDVSISMASHGCLTFFLYLEGSGWSCNFGGYCIGTGYLGSGNFEAENGKGLVAMMHIMDVVGVETWEGLKGKYCRVGHVPWGSVISKIGNVIEDRWFNIDEFFSNKEE